MAIVAATATVDPVVSVLHLTSNRARNAVETRAKQLAALRIFLAAAGVPETPAVVLGDFNFGDEGNEGAALSAYVDAWRALLPDYPGLTFDPGTNALAAITSLTGRAARDHRILVRSRPGAVFVLAPVSVELLGREAISTGDEAIHPSDHFGVAAEIVLGAAESRSLNKAPVHRSAVALLPPAGVWPPIQAIRTEFDKHVERWMPHINLLYGFLPESDFDDAAAELALALQDVAPFTVTLADFARFDHRASTRSGCARAPSRRARSRLCKRGSRRSFRSATSRARWASEALLRIFPLPSSGGKGGREQDGRVAPRLGAAVVSRRVHLPHQPPRRRAVRRPPGNPARRRAIARAALASCREGGAVLHLSGSARLGVRDAGGDLDVVFVGPADTPREVFFERLRAALELRARSYRARVIDAAFAPVLELSMNGTEVDVSYARLPAGAPSSALADPAEAARLALDPASLLSLSGALDADASVVARDSARLTERFHRCSGR